MAARALPLREGIAPVRDRLLTMLFLAALLHGLIILGLTFNVDATSGDSAPGLEVLLVSDELPTAERNDSAAYLAQRTQLGAGNTQDAVAPRNRASQVSIPGQPGLADGNALAAEESSMGGAGDAMLSTTAWSSIEIRYLADSGEADTDNTRPLLIEDQPGEAHAADDDNGPAQLRGPRRDELWVSPDSRAAKLAPYLDAWRRKVERIGTLNYPAAALAGTDKASPVLEVAIGSRGQLEKAEIRKSSGIPPLDQAALDILKQASPFDPFPVELAQEYRLLRFAYEWQFVGGRVQHGSVRGLP
jgi:periplasmic protein TonB